MDLRKYGNRRLYDPGLNRYITLTDVLGYVQRGNPVRVLEHKTDRDITAAILFDVLKLKNTHKPVLSTDELVHLICT